MLAVLPAVLLSFSAAAPRSALRMPAARMVATSPTFTPTTDDVTPLLSGLNGKAMLVEKEDIPSKAAVRAVVPDHCFARSTPRSLSHLVQSLVVTAATAALGLLIPLKLVALPLWIAYAFVTGTAAMGLWVLAHECGHGAFSDNRLLQDTVGYILHSALLVPYFSWQRSHAVHHAHTNHVYSTRSNASTRQQRQQRQQGTRTTHPPPYSTRCARSRPLCPGLRAAPPSQRARPTCPPSSTVVRAMRHPVARVYSIWPSRSV